MLSTYFPALCPSNKLHSREPVLTSNGPTPSEHRDPCFGWHDALLWMSYYSSHEATTAIYLAKIELKP